jgi:hypothetical protein
LRQVNLPSPDQPDPAPTLAPKPAAAKPAADAPSPATAASPARANPAAGAPAAIDPEKPVATADPRETWRDAIERLRRLARDRAGDPGASPEVWAVRARLLEALTRLDADLPRGALALWRTMLGALAVATEPEPEPAALARDADIRAAVRALEARTPLEIADLRICRKVDGFGDFEPLDPKALRAGQPVIVYCEVTGLRDEADGDAFRSRVSAQVELVAAPGGRSIWKQALGTADDLCRRRRRDFYVNYRIALPKDLAPGTYELRLSQTDALAGRAAARAIPLTIQK